MSVSTVHLISKVEAGVSPNIKDILVTEQYLKILPGW